MYTQRSLVLDLILSSLLVLAAGCATAAAPPEPPEPEGPCHRLLPAALLVDFKQRMPGFRVADDGYQRRAWDVVYTDQVCMTVASADFDGDLRPDFAFLADTPAGTAVLVAARQTSPDHWDLDQIFDFGPKPSWNLIVGKLEPGESTVASAPATRRWTILSVIVGVKSVLSEYGDRGWVSSEAELRVE